MTAAKLFLQTEGIIPAPEPSHAIKAVIDEALKCKETGEEKTLAFVLCGHGHFDMQAYDAYQSWTIYFLMSIPHEKVSSSNAKTEKSISMA